MENKKNYVDDIDVNENENLAILQDRMTDKEFTFCNAYQEDCSERENCHYKQLQRLKHQYADVLKLAKENADSNEFCLQELEQENEQLKKSIDRIMQNKEIKTIDLDIAKENERLKAENEKLNKMTGIFSARLCKKYRQTLQEIRNIAEKMYNTNDEDTERDLHIELQDKINEVIGVE